MVIHIKLILALQIFMAMSSMAYADVWTVSHKWDKEKELNFSQWVSSKQVNKQMFINPQSPYYGITPDCADLIYFLRAIYAYENKLPYSVTLPDLTESQYLPKRQHLLRSTHYPKLTQTTKMFDQIKDPHKRFLSFLKHVGLKLGSLNLGQYDSYPILVEKARPGDFYLFEVATKGRKIHHVLIIKEITPTGNFNFIYSTQGVRFHNLERLSSNKKEPQKSLRPLLYKTNQQVKYRPTKISHGLRRIIPPYLQDQSFSNFPYTTYYSKEQFTMAKKLNDFEFSKQIQEKLRIVNESPEDVIKRNLHNLCQLSLERIQVVWDGQKYLKSKKAQKEDYCMNFEEYDTHSTPMRDHNLKKSFNSLIDQWQRLDDKGLIGKVSTEEKKLIKGIFEHDKSSHQALLKFCPLPISEHYTIELGTLYNRLQRGKLSYDPHDPLEVRWGIRSIPSSHKCKRHYGFDN